MNNNVDGRARQQITPGTRALWARGALGAARYRSTGGCKSRRRRSGREPKPDD